MSTMTETSGELTDFLEEYFEQRPQLIRPERGVIGYLVQAEFLPVLQSLMNKHRRLEEVLTACSDR